MIGQQREVEGQHTRPPTRIPPNHLFNIHILRTQGVYKKLTATCLAIPMQIAAETASVRVNFLILMIWSALRAYSLTQRKLRLSLPLTFTLCEQSSAYRL